MILQLKRTPGIYLVGFMGCGKTTVGKLLARELGWQFVDIDREIEAEQKETISRIFELCGEQHFRALESRAIRQCVRRIQTGTPSVVALGGGAFARPGNVETLRDNGVSVWLDCPLEIVKRRVAAEDHRPLARDPGKFEELYLARRAAYGQADFRVEITGDDAGEALRKILQLPLF